MKKRGRKSQAELSVVRGFAKPPPAPPDELTDEQKAVWEAVAQRMPSDWFPAETHPQLAAYCRHTTRARFLAGLLDAVESKHLEMVEGLEHYDKMSRAAERESRAMLAAARALRLTPQSRYDAQKAARKAGSVPEGPKPWE